MKKLIKALIIVIIPLLAAFFTGWYAYNRYQTSFFTYYMEQASDTNTEDRLVSYLEFINQTLEYEKLEEGYEFFYSEDIKNADLANEDEDGHLFTFTIIRSNKVVNEEYINKKGTSLGTKDVNYVTYYIALYNINYTNLATTLDPTKEHKLNVDEPMGMKILFTDPTETDPMADDSHKFEKGLSTTAGVGNVVVYDYGYSPERDSHKKKLGNGSPMPLRYMVLNTYVDGTTSKNQEDVFKNFTSEVDITVIVSSSWANADVVEEEVCKLSFNNLYNHAAVNENTEVKEKIASFTETYDKDIFEAGYLKYAITKYIWWEALIAIAIFGIVCGSFIMIWSSEDAKNNQQNKNKPQKK